MEFSYRISEAQYAQGWNLGRGRRPAQATVKAAAFWVVITICLLVLWLVVSRNGNAGKEAEYSYSLLLQKVENGEVLDAAIRGNGLTGHLKAAPGGGFRTTLPANYDDLMKAMTSAKVNVTIKPKVSGSRMPLLLNFGPMIVILAVWYLLVRSGSMTLLPNYRKDPQMQGEFTVNITPAGISMLNTAGTSSQSGWNIYLGWRETRDLIVLKYLSGGQFILNVSALPEFQRQELRGVLSSVLPRS